MLNPEHVNALRVQCKSVFVSVRLQSFVAGYASTGGYFPNTPLPRPRGDEPLAIVPFCQQWFNFQVCMGVVHVPYVKIKAFEISLPLLEQWVQISNDVCCLPLKDSWQHLQQ